MCMWWKEELLLLKKFKKLIIEYKLQEVAEQPKKKENRYKKCFSFSQGRCCPFKKWNKDGLTLIDNLDANISGHINSLKV